MSSTEVVNDQMEKMRAELSEVYKEVGRMHEAATLLAKVLDQYEAQDVGTTPETNNSADAYRYCYTAKQKVAMNELVADIIAACKRA